MAAECLEGDHRRAEIRNKRRGLSQRQKSSYTRRRVIGSEQEYGIWDINRDDYIKWRIRNCGFLLNGSLLASDCDHPEYASAEASNPLDALLYDKAGEIIAEQNILGDVFLFKNNTDGTNSYASHENYSLSMHNILSGHDIEGSVLGGLINTILPFLTSRIVFAGSGRINRSGRFEISQKAGSTTKSFDSETICDKPIFNTRDDPLADASKYTRLHVVSGDGNLSEPALFLKYGTTALVLDLFEDGLLEPMTLVNPVGAFHRFSEDLSLQEKVKIIVDKGFSATNLNSISDETIFSIAYKVNHILNEELIKAYNKIRYVSGAEFEEERERLGIELNKLNAKREVMIGEEIEQLSRLKENDYDADSMTAVEIQKLYLEKAESAYRGRDDMTDDILTRWKYVLDALEDDPMKLDRWLDWVIKKRLIDSYMAKTDKSLDDPAVRNIDLQYHDINRSRGLFYKLQSNDLVDRVVTDEQIKHAVNNPPEDTRAWIRGKAVYYGWGDVGWDYILLGYRLRKMSSQCVDCSKNCKRYDEETTLKIDDPLHNYSELEDSIK